MFKLRFISILIGLCSLILASPGYAENLEKEASRLFDKRFSEKLIDGTGHVFGIVVDCDSKKLKDKSENLQKGRMEVYEYDFTFEVNTQIKTNSRILGGSFDKEVEACIITQYHNDVTFTPFSPKIMRDRIHFPVVLIKGEKPLFPRTPIGFVSEEK